MSKLMVSVSGVRGVIGETLTPSVIIRYISAFAQLINGKKIVIGSDSRVSREIVKMLASSTLMNYGYTVIDLGIVPTPTVQFLTEQLEADAGLVITASHNPLEWNGLKFIDSNGLFLSPKKCEQLFKLADTGQFNYKGWDQIGKLETYSEAATDHINAILKLSLVDKKLIRSKEFKVVLDTVNGAGGRIMNQLLTELGCTIIHINAEETGMFAHTPEPIPENLKDLAERVKNEAADFGIAVDPDVDRCVFINEHGQAIGEEYTLAMAVKLVLSKKLGHVVKNMSSSRAIDDIAKYYNCLAYETAVGEINVANKMIEINAVIGGEGNGGVMLPEIHIGRDAPVAAALALQFMAEMNKPLSEIKADLPHYEICKLKAPIDTVDPDKVIDYFKTQYQKEKLNDTDGLKISTQDWWVHLRKSNTEPIIRVIAEAENMEIAEKIARQFMDEIKSLS
ncbi:MAG: phosphoglucosamine mutase [Calditrichaeota bacterium]|nr:phosphoglucosamine mutase [Calditrichota bacterium]